MKVFFVNAEYDQTVTIPKKIVDKLPKKIMLFVTAQIITQLDDIKKQIEKSGREVILTKPRHTIHPGQILGCDTVNFDYAGDFDAFFYVGDGMFHPQALMMKNDKAIHIYNHSMGDYSMLTPKDAEIYRKRIQIAKAIFVGAKNVGVLVTTKPGQNKFLWYKAVEKKYPEKKFYYLVNNNIEFNRLEDFPFVDVFVNTACERIAYDDYKKFVKPVLNYEDLP